MVVSRKTRFDIFKRDNFICQYCGNKPPKVVLELDHIIPKSKDGKDSIDNFITSCVDCNRGKRDTLLTEIPESLSNNLSLLKEKHEQLAQLHKYIESQERKIQRDINKVDKTYNEFYEDWRLSESFKNGAVRTFVTELPPIKVIAATKMACSKVPNDGDRVLKYFCGICWRWIKEPNTRDW